MMKVAKKKEKHVNGDRYKMIEEYHLKMPHNLTNLIFTLFFIAIFMWQFQKDNSMALQHPGFLNNIPNKHQKFGGVFLWEDDGKWFVFDEWSKLIENGIITKELLFGGSFVARPIVKTTSTHWLPIRAIKQRWRWRWPALPAASTETHLEAGCSRIVELDDDDELELQHEEPQHKDHLMDNAEQRSYTDDDDGEQKDGSMAAALNDYLIDHEEHSRRCDGQEEKEDDSSHHNRCHQHHPPPSIEPEVLSRSLILDPSDDDDPIIRDVCLAEASLHIRNTSFDRCIRADEDVVDGIWDIRGRIGDGIGIETGVCNLNNCSPPTIPQFHSSTSVVVELVDDGNDGEGTFGLRFGNYFDDIPLLNDLDGGWSSTLHPTLGINSSSNQWASDGGGGGGDDGGSYRRQPVRPLCPSPQFWLPYERTTTRTTRNGSGGRRMGMAATSSSSSSSSFSSSSSSTTTTPTKNKSNSSRSYCGSSSMTGTGTGTGNNDDYDYDNYGEEDDGSGSGSGSGGGGSLSPSKTSLSTTQSSYARENGDVRRTYRRGRRSRDEQVAREYILPISAEELTSMSWNDVNHFIDMYDFDQAQVDIIYKIRRRGRNRIAARTSRKRRIEREAMGISS